MSNRLLKEDRSQFPQIHLIYDKHIGLACRRAEEEGRESVFLRAPLQEQRARAALRGLYAHGLSVSLSLSLSLPASIGKHYAPNLCTWSFCISAFEYWKTLCSDIMHMVFLSLCLRLLENTMLRIYAHGLSVSLPASIGKHFAPTDASGCSFRTLLPCSFYAIAPERKDTRMIPPMQLVCSYDTPTGRDNGF